jgi:hypothetical protein
VGVDGRGVQGVMAQPCLNEPQVDLGFQQMGGIGSKRITTSARCKNSSATKASKPL